MTTLRDYLTAIAVYLGESPSLSWKPDGDYFAAETGIFLKDVPIAPDRIVVIAAYLDDWDRPLPLREINFQARCRGSQDPLNCDDIAEDVRGLLHWQHKVTWNGVKIDRVKHLSTAILGPDAKSRWERTDNYQLITQDREQ